MAEQIGISTKDFSDYAVTTSLTVQIFMSVFFCLPIQLISSTKAIDIGVQKFVEYEADNRTTPSDGSNIWRNRKNFNN